MAATAKLSQNSWKWQRRCPQKEPICLLRILDRAGRRSIIDLYSLAIIHPDKRSRMSHLIFENNDVCILQ